MSDDLLKSLEWSCRDPVTHEPIDDGDYSNATVSEVKQAIAEITRLRARVAELEGAQARLILSLRLNMLRFNPQLSHEAISKTIEVALIGAKDE